MTQHIYCFGHVTFFRRETKWKCVLLLVSFYDFYEYHYSKYPKEKDNTGRIYRKGFGRIHCFSTCQVDVPSWILLTKVKTFTRMIGIMPDYHHHLNHPDPTLSSFISCYWHKPLHKGAPKPALPIHNKTHSWLFWKPESYFFLFRVGVGARPVSVGAQLRAHRRQRPFHRVLPDELETWRRRHNPATSSIVAAWDYLIAADVIANLRPPAERNIGNWCKSKKQKQKKTMENYFQNASLLCAL